MRKIAGLILALAWFGFALAQVGPGGGGSGSSPQNPSYSGLPTELSTPIGGTVTTGGTYQQVLAQNLARFGCAIQNQSSGTEFFYLGSTANANSAGTSAGASGVSEVSPLGWFYCASSGDVAGDAVQVTSATMGAQFAGDAQ